MRGIRLALLAIAACLVSVSLASAGTRGDETRSLAARASLSRAILVELNAVRSQHGMPRLRASGTLEEAAERHSFGMARGGYFAHESADGTTFSDRIKRFYPSAGFRVWRVGENLLWASPDVTPAQTVKAWMDSPAHRRVLLMSEWREIGLSAVHGARLRGEFGGREVTIVTADFGARSR